MTLTADLLRRVSDAIERYVVLPSGAASVALALFVLHTWTIEAADATLYLAVVSAEKQSGKTRLLEVLRLLVREPWHTASATEAAIFRKIERDAPTLLLDEVDAIFGFNSERTEPLRAVLNAGNRRGTTATRVVGQGGKMEVKDFSVFCAKVLAGIDTGQLPETIQDRAAIIHMKRRRSGESVERLHYRTAQERTEPLKYELAAWAASEADHLRQRTPELPEELSDRAAEAWEPLLAIAELAEDDWPTRACAAAVELSASVDDGDLGRGAQLLAAIREAMAGRESATTAHLLRAINADDSLPFGGWKDGKGLDARGLAHLLRPYGIKPQVIRVEDKTPRGYRAVDLRDAWERYLPPPEAKHPQQAQQAPRESIGQPSNVAAVSHVAARARVNGLPAADPDCDAEVEQAESELVRLAEKGMA